MKLEVIWTAIPLVLVFVIFAASTPVTFRMLDHRQAPGAHYTNLVTASLPVLAAAKTVNLQLALTSPPPNVTTNVTLRLGSLLAPARATLLGAFPARSLEPLSARRLVLPSPTS